MTAPLPCDYRFTQYDARFLFLAGFRLPFQGNLLHFLSRLDRTDLKSISVISAVADPPSLSRLLPHR